MAEKKNDVKFHEEIQKMDEWSNIDVDQKK